MQVEQSLFQQASKVLTVAELTRQIRGTLEARFGAVWVQGEVSNYKLHPSGHQYFTLKDQRGHSRPAECFATARAVAANPDQSCTRTRNGCRGGHCGGDSRARNRK